MPFLPHSQRRLYLSGKFHDEGDPLNDPEFLFGLPQLSGVSCNGSSLPVNCRQAEGSGYYIIGKCKYTTEDEDLTKAGGTKIKLWVGY
jgi:hypothetical protein